MSQIREIVPEDLPVLVAYGEYFWSKTPYAGTGIEYNPERVEILLRELDDNHYLKVLEHELDGIIGFIGFLITPIIFNDDYNVAAEAFFFIHPEHRGSNGRVLLQQAELDLKDRADIISMGEMRSSKDMDEWYATQGYTLTERTFSKVI
jgi:GNAT superfamily N-acetyltransferase